LQHCDTVFGCTSRSSLCPWFSTINLKSLLIPCDESGSTLISFSSMISQPWSWNSFESASFHPLHEFGYTYLRVGTSPWSLHWVGHDFPLFGLPEIAFHPSRWIREHPTHVLALRLHPSSGHSIEMQVPQYPST
jgi:hypothetical protein